MLTSKVTRTYIRRNPHDVNTTPSQGKPLGQSNQIKRHTKSSAWPFYCPPLPPLSQVHVLVFNASLSPKRHPSLSPHFDLPDQNQAGHMVSVPWTLRTFSGTLQSVYEECDRVGLASRVTQPADYVVPWALWLSFRVFGLYRNLWTCVRKTHSTSCPSHPCGMMPHHVRGRRTFGEVALITTNLTPDPGPTVVTILRNSGSDPLVMCLTPHNFPDTIPFFGDPSASTTTYTVIISAKYRYGQCGFGEHLQAAGIRPSQWPFVDKGLSPLNELSDATASGDEFRRVLRLFAHMVTLPRK